MRTASARMIAQYTALSPFWPVVLSVKESFCLNHWYKTLKQNETRQIRKKKHAFSKNHLAGRSNTEMQGSRAKMELLLAVAPDKC